MAIASRPAISMFRCPHIRRQIHHSTPGGGERPLPQMGDAQRVQISTPACPKIRDVDFIGCSTHIPERLHITAPKRSAWNHPALGSSHAFDLNQ